MKKLIQLLAILIAAATVGCSSDPGSKLYGSLATGGKVSATAIESNAKKTGEATALTLFMASAAALEKEDYTNSAYLFYVAKFRAQFDTKVFPPAGTGGDSPLVLFGALSHQIGSVVNPEIMRRPQEFAASLQLAKDWVPLVTDHYKPGWEYIEKKSVEAAMKDLKEIKNDFNEGMGGISELLLLPSYFEAFKTVQDYNMRFDDSRPSKEIYDAAVVSMKEMEKSKGIRGMFYDPNETE